MILSNRQRQQLLDALEGDRKRVLYMLALHLGMRKGELIRLRWSDIDLEGKTLRVVQSKTEAGKRTVPLSAKLVQALRDHWLLQQQERSLRELNWQEHGLVFPSEAGTPLSDSNLWRHFQLLKRAGLSAMPFHDLRTIALRSCSSRANQQ